MKIKKLNGYGYEIDIMLFVSSGIQVFSNKEIQVLSFALTGERFEWSNAWVSHNKFHLNSLYMWVEFKI